MLLSLPPKDFFVVYELLGKKVYVVIKNSQYICLLSANNAGVAHCSRTKFYRFIQKPIFSSNYTNRHEQTAKSLDHAFYLRNL